MCKELNKLMHFCRGKWLMTDEHYEYRLSAKNYNIRPTMYTTMSNPVKTIKFYLKKFLISFIIYLSNTTNWNNWTIYNHL